MKKVLLIVAALIGMLVVDIGAAQATGGGWPRRARVNYAPQPSVVVAQGQTGYRSYSYEPSTGYRTYSYQPAPTYSAPRATRGSYRQYSGFGDATRKALGNY